MEGDGPQAEREKMREAVTGIISLVVWLGNVKPIFGLTFLILIVTLLYSVLLFWKKSHADHLYK